ncbi:MAG: universal stress protein [Chloroflexi bacterium]|nr:universal stress protein [Chloroflexota bacterium]
MFDRILVPLDGSEHAERICGWVMGFAKTIGAEVELFAVVNPARLTVPEAGARRSAEAPVESEAGPQVVDPAVEQALRYLEHRALGYEEIGVKAATKAVVGNPAEEIVKRAASAEIDMIAMATRRESALARGILGSVTDRVLHNTPVPLLTIRPQDGPSTFAKTGRPGIIVVPLDGSEVSERAVPVALFLAKASGAEVIFLQALPPPYVAAGELGVHFYTSDYVMSEEREEVFRYLSAFVERAREEGVEATVRAPVGTAAACIVESIENQPGGLVVMSTHGASGFKRWVVGSVADKVIRSSGRPVLVLPSRDASD